MPLVKHTPMVLEISRRDLTNRVGRDHVWPARVGAGVGISQCPDRHRFPENGIDREVKADSDVPGA